jgi:hypothetical protein
MEDGITLPTAMPDGNDDDEIIRVKREKEEEEEEREREVWKI